MMKILKTPLIWRCQNSCSWTTAAAVVIGIAMDPVNALIVGVNLVDVEEGAEDAEEVDVRVIVPTSAVAQNSVTAGMYRLFSILCSLYLLLFFSHQYCVFSYTSSYSYSSGRGRRGICRRRNGGRSNRREVRLLQSICNMSSSQLFSTVCSHDMFLLSIL